MKKFRLESDLCDYFMGLARDSNWQVYPEQNDWDMIIVRNKIQVGIQAKLIANNDVLLQALPKLPYKKIGPHYRAVLISGYRGRTVKARNENRKDFYALANYLKLVVIDTTLDNLIVCGPTYNFHKTGYNMGYQLNLRYYHCRPSEIEWYPPFIPILPAGVPSPVKVSKWKLAVLDLREIELEKGYICLADCKHMLVKYKARWNSGSLLSAYWYSTGEKIKDTRQTKWVLKYNGVDPNKIFENIRKMK